MNREQKEKNRKYNEARFGKTDDEIAEIDKQDLINEQIDNLARKLHAEQFPEEGDYHYDSCADYNDRRKGINPMLPEYTKKVNEKRIKQGFQALSKSGYAVGTETFDYCIKQAKQLIKNEIK